MNTVTIIHHHHHHQSLNREGRWGTTDDFATSFLHCSLFSTALWDLVKSRPVHSLMLSSHLFLCLPCLLSPFTAPCKVVLARPNERETLPYHCSLRLFTVVRGSSCGPIACWILARTSSLVAWSLYEMFSILRCHLISMACILLLCGSAVRVHDLQAYRKMDATREHISRILEPREILLSIQTGFSLVNAAVVCAIQESISVLEPSSVITEPRYLKLVTV